MLRAGVQATRERFTEYIAVMKKALRDAAEASAAHSAGIQLLTPSSNESAQANPPPGMLPSTSLRPMHLAVTVCLCQGQCQAGMWGRWLMRPSVKF